jgi:hypothetical protein
MERPNNMFAKLTDYAKRFVHWFAAPQHYGTRLEQYIVSHKPTTTCQVEALERKFDLMYSARNKSWMI